MKILGENNLFKKNWAQAVQVILFFLAIWGYLTFEIVYLLKFLIVLLTLGFFFYYYKTQKNDYLVLFFLFLAFSTLYHFYFGFNYSFTLIILAVISISSFSYYVIFNQKYFSSYLNLALIALVLAELFIILISWPIEARGKALILTSFFFTYIEIVKLKIKSQFTFDKIIPPIVIFIILVFAVIFTSHWLSY